jgi:hypothetical protein
MSFHLWTPVGAMPPSQPAYLQFPQQYYTPHPPPYGQYGQLQPQSFEQAAAQSYHNPANPLYAQYGQTKLHTPGPPTILSPVPLAMPSKPPSPSSLLSEKSGRSNSISSLTPAGPLDEKRGLVDDMASSGNPLVSSTMSGVRFVTIQAEAHKAKDDEELRHELKGKRVWRTGGLGVWTFSENVKDEERKRKLVKEWNEKHGKDDWLKAARARTDFYTSKSHVRTAIALLTSLESRGLTPLVKWRLVERGGRPPDDALPIGHEENGTFLYACRAWLEGGLHIGK